MLAAAPLAKCGTVVVGAAVDGSAPRAATAIGVTTAAATAVAAAIAVNLERPGEMSMPPNGSGGGGATAGMMERMCGRFVSSSSPETIAEYFGATFEGETLGQNFNVAPTSDIYGVVADQDGAATKMPSEAVAMRVFHWGLVPSWAKERKIGARMINARAETLADKPAFKSVFRKHRCLIPMDGFYEWKAGSADGPLNAKGKPVKQPMFVHRNDGAPLAVAGLWAAWKDPEATEAAGEDQWLHSATVVTTSANSTMRAIHDRMPVILPRSVWAEWLDPQMHDLDRLSGLLVPAADDVLTMHPVSTDVNNVRNKGAELVEAVPA